jgi:hypothetical protein
VSTFEAMRRSLDACPPGSAGWSQFEELCTEVLTALFVPPLQPPKIQCRSFSGTDRRDAVFPNRNQATGNHWGFLQKELDARLVLFEFKNYDKDEIGTEEILRTRSYLNLPMGRLAVIIGTKLPNASAHIKRNTIYSTDRTVILFLTKEHLKEMLYMKEREEDPADLIVDAIEEFYLQHE